MDATIASLHDLAEALRSFNAERGWGRYHTPRQLATALSVEAGELLELFLWKDEGDLPDRERLGEEMADVLICLTNLASRLDLDLLEVARDKIAKNGTRYPVERARGRADKWDVLQREAGAGSEDGGGS